MIERAARALVVELARQDGIDITPERVAFWNGLEIGYIDQTGVDVGALVRAVLTAMREPSETMDRAGSAAAAYHGQDGEKIWQAMLDAALAEGDGR